MCNYEDTLGQIAERILGSDDAKLYIKQRQIELLERLISLHKEMSNLNSQKAALQVEIDVITSVLAEFGQE